MLPEQLNLEMGPLVRCSDIISLFFPDFGERPPKPYISSGHAKY